MTFITFDELSPGKGYPKMKNNFSNNDISNKKEIVNSLKGGTIVLAKGSRSKDCFTGEVIPFEILVMEKGNYAWSNVLAWYVEKYNLILPEEFLNYILSK